VRSRRTTFPRGVRGRLTAFVISVARLAAGWGLRFFRLRAAAERCAERRAAVRGAAPGVAHAILPLSIAL